MDSFTVKTRNGTIKSYMAPTCSTIDLKKVTSTPYEQTDDEKIQGIYESIVDDARRDGFEKTIVFLLKNYSDFFTDDWINIQIKTSFTSKEKRSEYNIVNPERRFKLPDEDI